MRLTLRTLLAYLDDILEPADARDLGQKIDESEFASGLVHRIRSVTRKQRLGAPKLSGKGMGLDANTVAEYLDNTLPQDRVPDFEKVCLESDVHLAEAASCHQILTLVLGEPADVDPALRDRIRSLQARIDALGEKEPIPPATPGKQAPPVVTGAPPIDHRNQDREWEDEPETPLVKPAAMSAMAPRSSIRLLPVVGTLVVAFLLALAALVAMGPLDGDHPILGSILADGSPTEGTAPDGSSTAQATADTTPTQREQSAADENGAKTTDASNPAAQEVAQPAAEPPAVDSAATGSDTNAFPAPPISVKPEPTAEPVPSETAAGTKAPPRSLLDRDPRDGSPPSTVMGDADAASEPAADAAAEPAPLARCLSNLHVLASFDATTENWLRLTANDPIAPQQELVALPTYRPQIAFGSGIQLMLIGPAAVSLRDPGPDGVPGLVVHYGRILASTDGSPNAALDIQIGERLSRITFPGLDSSLALDVQRYHEPGTNPEEQAAHWLIQAQTAAGQLGWQDQGAADALALESGSLALMIGTEAPQLTTGSPLPEWLDAKNLRPIDRDASEQLEPLLELKRPLTTSLLEQTTNRLVEVRTLAIRSLCLLGTYDSFIITAFNSKTYRTFWPDLLLSLQIAVARDAESATQVRTTLERLRGTDGSQLFRFLWGFSPQQLADGDAATLVEALGSPSMDIRVFAYENLYHIVAKTNSYQPEIEPNRQRRAILNWQRDLKQGTITYKNPSSGEDE